MTARERLKSRILALFFPKRCALCDTLIPFDRACCDSCERTLPVIEPPRCTYCGQHKKQCGCGKRRRAFDGIAAPFYYEETVRDGILRLKRYDDPDAVAYFADRMRETVEREYGNQTFDGITYVPMTRRDLRSRGYNQGQLLARALGERLQVPVWDTLTKLYETPPQKERDFLARSGNVLGVFDVIYPCVRGKTILLVDDVMTTGSTLRECAKMLKIGGAAHVSAVTIAVRKYQKKTEEVE